MFGGGLPVKHLSRKLEGKTNGRPFRQDSSRMRQDELKTH
ncbi:hypothetical protein MALU111345_20045 [Marinicrinis lubricantis]